MIVIPTTTTLTMIPALVLDLWHEQHHVRLLSPVPLLVRHLWLVPLFVVQHLWLVQLLVLPRAVVTPMTQTTLMIPLFVVRLLWLDQWLVPLFAVQHPWLVRLLALPRVAVIPMTPMILLLLCVVRLLYEQWFHLLFNVALFDEWQLLVNNRVHRDLMLTVM